MNLPNRLTVMRAILTPFFMAALIINFPFHNIVALLIFIIASLTDMLDGKIARKYNLVTDFGKFVDPLADKMLTTAAFIGFLAKGIGSGMEWILFIVLFREFMIASLRLVAVSSNEKKVIPANIWGKLKTVSQMVAVIYTLLILSVRDIVSLSAGISAALDISISVLLWLSAALAVISGVIYLKDGLKFVDSSK